MLNTQEKKTRLTNLLSRIENNRSRMGVPRAAVPAGAGAAPAPVANLAEELEDAEAFPAPTPRPSPVTARPKPAPAPLVEEPTADSDEHDDDEFDFGIAAPHEAVDASAPVEVNEPIPSLPPEQEPPAADSIAGALDSVIPAAAETETAPMETKSIEATRTASKDVVEVNFERPAVNWSIEAVLNRAWQVGAK